MQKRHQFHPDLLYSPSESVALGAIAFLSKSAFRSCVSKIALKYSAFLLMTLMLCDLAVAQNQQSSPSPRASQSLSPEDIQQPIKMQELAFGHILFEYYRGDPITALNAILVAQKKGLLNHHQQSASLLSGVIYLDLGMLAQAQSIFNQLLSEQVLKSEVFSRLEFYLGKLHFRQGDFDQAKIRLQKSIKATVEDNNKLNSLSSNSLIDSRSFRDQALIMLSHIAYLEGDKAQSKDWLKEVSVDSIWAAYSRYNLGVAWLSEDNIEQALPLLTKLFGLSEDQQNLSLTPESMSETDATDATAATNVLKVSTRLQDKAKVSLGYYYLSKNMTDKARAQFLSVKLDSLQASKALLGMGWSYLESKQYSKALSHWLALAKRDAKEIAVQEALMAIPYAYQQLGAEQLALDNYLLASQQYQQQLDQIDRLVNKIERQGFFEQKIQSVLAAQTDAISDASIKNSDLMGTDYDYYLFELFSQHQFNEGFRSFQKLARLAQLVDYWVDQLPLFDEILKVNQIRFDNRIPIVEKYLQQGAFESFQQQLATLRQDIHQFKLNQQMYLLGDETQIALHTRISRLMQNLAQLSESAIDEQQKLKATRAQGVLQWQLETGKVAKIWQLEKTAVQISKIISELERRRGSLTIAREKAGQRFSGFQQKVDINSEKLIHLKAQIAQQLQQQTLQLNSQVIAMLNQRKQSLQHFLLQADLAIARMHSQSLDLSANE